MVSQIFVFWLFSLLNGFAIGVVGPIYIVFLRSFGLSFFQVNLLNAVYITTVFLCEIPTGSIADYYGRKTSVLIGCLISVIGGLIYGMSSGFLVFLWRKPFLVSVLHSLLEHLRHG